MLAALTGISVLAFFIFRPFLYALALAAVFSVVFQPVYQRMVRYVRGRQGLAALATILIVIILIFTPLVFLGIQIFQEAQQLYSSLIESGGKDAVLTILSGLMERIQKYVPAAQEFSVNINQYLKQGYCVAINL